MRIVAAPIAFFDVTPTGRILNRFTADMDGVDMQLGRIIAQFVNSVFNVIVGLLTVVIATRGFFAILLVPLSLFFYRAQKVFRKTSTEVQRLESISNSPIFAHFGETLTGLSTIRAFGQGKQFQASNALLLDDNNTAKMLRAQVASWLAMRLEFVGSLTAVCVALYAVLSQGKKGFEMPIGWAAVGLVSALQYVAQLKFCVTVGR